MKKRKPPFVLATFLVIMLIAVAIVYKPTGGQGDGHDHGTPPPQQEQASNQERPKITPQQSTEVMKNAMAPTAGGSAVKMDRPGGPTDEPSIKLMKGKPYKPTPSDSSISTQWYTDETRK